MILRVTPSKRPEVADILSHAFFEEHKEESSMNLSTEDSRSKPSMQYLSESCNPKSLMPWLAD